jgi:hypothetical protein
MGNLNIQFIILLDSLFIGDLLLKTLKIMKITGDLIEKIKAKIPIFKSIPHYYYQMIF